MDEFKQFIKNIAPISDKEFYNSLAYFREIHLQKGEYFVYQDKVCKQIAFIAHGTLRSFYLNHKGEETTSCFCSERNFSTSFRSFILQQVSDISIQAIEDTTLFVIDYESLQKLYATSPTWQNIGRKVAEKEYMVMEKYASVLNNETAKEKYMRLINEQPSVIHKATVEDIASYLGVTRRTLSRIRQEISK